MLSLLFKDVRKLLGDTFEPYRNTDEDLIDGLASCLDRLYREDKDLFLNESFQIENNFEYPVPREDSTSYDVGDFIHINDPIDLYICTVAGVSNTTPVDFDGDFIVDGTVSWSRWCLPEGIHSNAVLHYICWFCLMMDNDEQANERNAAAHLQLFGELK